MNNRFSKHTDTTSVEQSLEKLFASVQPSPVFKEALYDRLNRQAEQLHTISSVLQSHDTSDTGRRTQLRFNLVQWGRRLAYSFSLLVVVGLLLSFRPVRAAVERFIGYAYIPQAGFIDLSDTQMLDGPTAQIRDGRRLTITQAVLSSTGVKVWFRLEGEALILPELNEYPHAWLETANGEGLEPWAQNWSSNNKEATEGYLEFRPAVDLKEARNMVLRMQPNWAIPLRFGPSLEVGVPSITLYPDACKIDLDIRLCVLVVKVDEDGTHILIGGETTNHNFQLFNLVSANPLTGEMQAVLKDEQGHILKPLAILTPPIPLEVPPGGQQRYTETLHFEAAARDTGTFTIQIPAISIQVPMKTNFVVDVGSNPQPGDEYDLDTSVEVDGQVLYFDKGEVVKDNYGTRFVMAGSPLTQQDDRLVTALNIAVSAALGNSPTVGTSFEPLPDALKLDLWWTLENEQGQALNGKQYVMIESAQVTLTGPFEITWKGISEP